MPVPSLLSAAEVANRIGISCAKVYALAAKRLLPVYRCGAKRRRLGFVEEDIVDFIEQCRLGEAGRFRTQILKQLTNASS